MPERTEKHKYTTVEALIEGEVKPFIADNEELWDMMKSVDMPMSQRGLVAYQMARMDTMLLPAELVVSSLDAVAKLYGAALGLPIPE